MIQSDKQNYQPNLIEAKNPPDSDMANISMRLFFAEKMYEVYKTPPTYQPTNYKEEFCIYDDGTNRRLYIFVAGTWRYVTLT